MQTLDGIRMSWKERGQRPGYDEGQVLYAFRTPRPVGEGMEGRIR